MADADSAPHNTDAADAFISKWQGVAASELSTSQSFLIDLSSSGAGSSAVGYISPKPGE